jgi:hypothetical protein
VVDEAEMGLYLITGRRAWGHITDWDPATGAVPGAAVPAYFFVSLTSRGDDQLSRASRLD